MESLKVFVFSAVFIIALVMVNSAPYPGLLSGLFGDGLSPPKQNPMDINQLLRQYYLSPTDNPYGQYNNNPFGAGQLNYAQQNGPQNYQAYPSMIDPGFAGPGFENSNGNPSGYGSLLQYRAAPPAAPAVRSADDSFASHYSRQLDSLLPSSGKAGFQNFANFRILPSAEAEDQQHQNAEPLPAQSALQGAQPAARALPERAPTQASRIAAEEQSSNKDH